MKLENLNKNNMSRLRKLNKDKKIRVSLEKSLLRRRSFQFLLKSPLVNEVIRKLITCYFLKKVINRVHKSAVVNYCIYSYNPRWVFKLMHLSRHEFKRATTTGIFMGIKKAI
jgi:ribosomal protein S14